MIGGLVGIVKEVSARKGLKRAFSVIVQRGDAAPPFIILLRYYKVQGSLERFGLLCLHVSVSPNKKVERHREDEKMSERRLLDREFLPRKHR